jgi:hypothetical protein
MEGMLNIDDLVSLAADGNPETAQRFIKNLPEASRTDASIRICQAEPKSGQVRAPLVLDDGSVIMASVEVGPGTFSRLLAKDAQEAMEEAIAEARELTGAPAAATVGVVGRVAVADKLSMMVSGRSLYLPTLIECVRYLGDAKLAASVAATGCFDAPLDCLPEKLEASRTSDPLLKHRSLLAAGYPAPSTQKDLIVCDTPETVVHRVFGATPWHSDADVTCLHVYSKGRDACPIARPSAKIVPIEVSDPITCADLPDIEKRVRSQIAPGGRYQITVGGPIIVAAKLGTVLKNVPAEVQFVDARTKRPWWSNRALNFIKPDPGHDETATRKVLICSQGSQWTAGWESFIIPDSVTQQGVAAIVGEFLAKYACVGDLHVAFRAPLALAFAIASVLHKRGMPTRYYHRNESVQQYECWFGPDN